jgi:AcrR family transcriptional regulator
MRRGANDVANAIFPVWDGQLAALRIDVKGYEAATMAEIAARSSTKIGSLYRFFPNKEVRKMLIAHYHEGVHNAFDELDSRIQSLSISALADFLLDLMVDLLTRLRKLRWSSAMAATSSSA